MAPALVTTGLSATTGTLNFAAGVLDSVPLAKQIVLTSARITAIAETINKNREALHDLSNQSTELADLIKETLSGRSLGEALKKPLSDVFEAISDVERFMQKYRDKKAYKKLLSILFQAGDVERLKDDLWKAKKNFTLAASLDTNVHVVATHKIVKADAQFHGSIVNLHDAEVDKDDGPNGFICKMSIFKSGPVVKYYRASVRPRGENQGRVMVIRVVDRPSIPTGDAAVEASRRLEEFDRVLMELTAPACQHRYIAKIFGRSDDEPLRRFTVLKLDTALISGTKFILERKEARMNTGIALKLMDAAAHLNHHEIDWVPQNKDFLVDLNGKPIIGLNMDLRKRVPENAVTVYQTQMDALLVLYEHLPSWVVPPWEVRQGIKEVRYRLFLALRGLSDDSVARPLSRMVAKLSVARKVSLAIQKFGMMLPNLQLNGDHDYLSKVNTVLHQRASYQPYIWGRIMSSIAKRKDCKELRADYCPSDEGDVIVIIWLDTGRGTSVCLDLFRVEIPDNGREEFRRTFNITPELIASNTPSLRLF